MCEISPTSTQGCAGAPGCLENAWEMWGESDTMLLFISERVMGKDEAGALFQ